MIALKPSRRLALAVVVVFGGLGYGAMQLGQAASFVASAELEDTAPTGMAVVVRDPDASGTTSGGAVRFGGSAVPVPNNLRAFAGGDSIALTWRPRDFGGARVTSYNVYRNGVKIATTTPDTNAAGTVTGSQYIDSTIVTGQTYRYTVQTVLPDGNVSVMSEEVTSSRSSSAAPVPTVVVDPSVNQYAPEMVDWLQSYAIPAIKTWYPKMSEALARPDYTPPSTITIKTLNQAAYEATYPASTALAIGADIVFNIANVNVDRSRAVGTFVHEAAHVMQYYDNGTFNGTSIRWIAEGLADYVRYDMYNAYPYNVDYLTQATTAKSHYSEGYAPAANFMRWLSQKYGTNYLKDANVASYKGTYSAQSMQFSDGRNLDEAWALFRNTPTQTGDFKNQSQTTACLDIKDASTRNGALLQVWSCNGSIQQKLTYRPRPDTTVATVMTLGRCMEAANSATANGTTVWSRECNTKPGQDWVHRSDGSLFNPNSNRCLAIANAASGIVNGAGLQIRDCDASPAQRWTIPASK